MNIKTMMFIVIQVGGDFADTIICEHMADNGRVVIIGAISGYNTTEAAKGLFTSIS